MSNPDLSVIIVSYNTCDLLRGSLLSLQRAEEELSFEVIVVDNASTDGSMDMVRREFPTVRIAELNKNEGFAAAMQRGIGMAEAELFLTLNPDTFVPRRSLPRLVEFIRSHPQAAIVGAGLTFSDGTAQPSAFGFPGLVSEFWNALPELKSFLKLRKISEIIHWNRGGRPGEVPAMVDSVSGAAFIARKSVIDQIGGFDPEFFLYHEERDLCERLRKAGWEIWFVPEIQVIHFDAQASGYRTNRLPGMPVLEWRTLGMSRLWKKHKSQSAHRLWRMQTEFLFTLRSVLLWGSMGFRSPEGRLRARARIDELKRVVRLLKSD